MKNEVIKLAIERAVWAIEQAQADSGELAMVKWHLQEISDLMGRSGAESDLAAEVKQLIDMLDNAKKPMTRGTLHREADKRGALRKKGTKYIRDRVQGLLDKGVLTQDENGIVRVHPQA